MIKGLFKFLLYNDVKTESESDNIKYLFDLVFWMMSKARSMAVDSALKIEQLSGRRFCSIMLLDMAALPALFSSLEPSV